MELNLFESEYKFMNIVWDYEPINSTLLSKICLEKLGWKKSTTYNMIRKLSERNILINNQATVTSIIKRHQLQKYESETIVDRSFEGSLPSFVAAFLDQKKISKKEADELKKIIEEAMK